MTPARARTRLSTRRCGVEALRTFVRNACPLVQRLLLDCTSGNLVASKPVGVAASSLPNVKLCIVCQCCRRKVHAPRTHHAEPYSLKNNRKLPMRDVHATVAATPVPARWPRFRTSSCELHDNKGFAHGIFWNVAQAAIPGQ